MSLSGVAKSARGRTVVPFVMEETDRASGGVVPWAVGALQLVSSHDGEEHIGLAGNCSFVHPAPGTFKLVVDTCVDTWVVDTMFLSVDWSALGAGTSSESGLGWVGVSLCLCFFLNGFGRESELSMVLFVSRGRETPITRGTASLTSETPVCVQST